MKKSKHNVIPSTNFNNKIPAVILMGVEMCSPGILLGFTQLSCFSDHNTTVCKLSMNL